MGFQGGKMLLRIDPEDPASVVTLESCARAIGELADRGLMAMVEPFISHRTDGRVGNDLTTEAVVRSAAVGAGLGRSSAHTWLKLPVIDDMDPVLDSTALPVLLLGVRCRPTRTRSSPGGSGHSPTRRCGGWSWVARSSTRPAATWPRPSTPSWG